MTKQPFRLEPTSIGPLQPIRIGPLQPQRIGSVMSIPTAKPAKGRK